MLETHYHLQARPMKYLFLTDNRNYEKWTFHEQHTMKPVDLDVNPVEKKLFSMDAFNFSDESSKEICIEDSQVRTNRNIPGVLILKTNRTYGIHNNGKRLYRCVPDDKRIPVFLVPYERKNMGFAKHYVNLYVTFEFDNWDDDHPTGKLTSSIGEVDWLPNYYEYQLHCKSLNVSISSFSSSTRRSIVKKRGDANEDEHIMAGIYTYYNSREGGSDTDTDAKETKSMAIEDRTSYNVFTIDPELSTDFDDGFSIQTVYCDRREKVITEISVYISNVSILLDYLGLWKSFSNRVSTIYLPDRKRPMLPNILSDKLCSLVEKMTRFAFTVDFIIEDGNIIDVKYCNSMIQVRRNFRYEEPDLLRFDDYNKLLNTTKDFVAGKSCKYITQIHDSHDLVAYLMVLMNYETARRMMDAKIGIFRNLNLTVTSEDTAQELPGHVREDKDLHLFFKVWNNATAKYIDLSKNELDDATSLRHDLMEVEAYSHITSPSRRLVDLMNILRFQKHFNMIQLNAESDTFYEERTEKMEYINTTMRAIRKVQNDCRLLAMIANDGSIMEKEHEGFVFDRIDRTGTWQYTVYIPSIKLVSKLVTCKKMENYDKHIFNIHMFEDEDCVKKKVRLSLIDS